MPFKKITVYLLLAIILFFAFWLRRDAFWLPHWRGDQNHYAALAMKLDKMGFGGYNLREVQIGGMVASKEPPVLLIFFKPGPAGDEGDILRPLKAVGQSYYDEPLHYRAPLFPYALMLSHRLFAGNQEVYSICTSNLGERVRTIKPEIILKAQFWAALVPVFFNLAVIFMTFLLGWKFFNEKTGLLAAFLMAINPLGLFLSYKLLVEDMMVFFMMLSLFLYLLFFKKKNFGGIVAAGIALGLAVLTKQTAGLLLPVVWAYTVLADHPKSKGVRAFFPPEFMLYAFTAFLVSVFWFVKVWQTFGSPLHQAGALLPVMKTDLTGWFYGLTHRPPPFIFFSLGVIGLSPFFALALLTFRKFYRQTAAALSSTGDGGMNYETMFWLWILAYYFFNTEPWHLLELMANQEHRFFYMAYPAIAVLAASAWDNLRSRWAERHENCRLFDLTTAGVLFFSVYWGIPQVMKVIFSENLLY